MITTDEAIIEDDIENDPDYWASVTPRDISINVPARQRPKREWKPPSEAAPVQLGKVEELGTDEALKIHILKAPPLITVDEDAEFQQQKMFPPHPKTDLPTLNFERFECTYIKMRAIRWSNGLFYTPKGEALTENQIRKELTELVRKCLWTGDASKMVASMLKSITALTDYGDIEARKDIIPFSNGDLIMKKDGWEFVHGQYTYIPYRLKAKYYAKDVDAPLFNKWLHDAFYEEDIPSVQQFMGAMFLPDTKIQEMMILYGNGGLGKSVLGNILKAVFGDAMMSTKIQILAEDKFEAARLQYKLVCFDDDLGSAALKETGTLKELITSEKSIRAERKYQSAYEFRPYATFMACTNMPLESLYDVSDGFFRRIHTIVTKPKDPDRKDIKDMSDRIIEEELTQVVRWMLKGLQDLIANGYNVHESVRSSHFRDSQRSERNHLPDFFEDCVEIGEKLEVSIKDLETAYKRWCIDNAVTPQKPAKFKRWMQDHQDFAGYKLDKHVNRTKSSSGVRGYRGIGLI